MLNLQFIILIYLNIKFFSSDITLIFELSKKHETEIQIAFFSQAMKIIPHQNQYPGKYKKFILSLINVPG